MLTKTITEKEVLQNILKGKYKFTQLNGNVKYTIYSDETFELFKKDLLDLLVCEYNFGVHQSEIIFNRGWTDCSSGGLHSVLDEVVDLAQFSAELIQA